MEASDKSSQSASTVSTGMARRRRRPPSLFEQRNRTARMLPLADYYKAEKRRGRWG